MKIRINIYLITAILLTQNLFAKCESGSDASYTDINHEPLLYSAGPLSDDKLDHLNHLDFSNYLGGEGPDNHESMTQFQTNSLQSNNFGNNDDNNNKVMHSVDITHHDGNTITKYETTTHTDQDTNNGAFDDQLLSSNKQSNMPGTYTKVIKKTVIKRSKNGGNNNSKESGQMVRKKYSENKSKEIDTDNPLYSTQTISQIDRLVNNGIPPIPPHQISGTPGNSQNVIKTIVTKTTTSGLPTDDFNGSIRKIRLNGLKSIPSNIAFTKMSPSNINHNSVISSVLPANQLDEGGRFKTESMIADLIDGHSYNGMDEQRVLLKPEGSFKRTQTTIIKRQGKNDDNDLDDLDDHRDRFDNANARFSNNNIVQPTMNPSEYSQFITTSTTNSAQPLHIKNSSLNPDSFGQTQTMIVKRDDGDSNDGNYFGNLNDHVVASYNNNDGKMYSSNSNTNYNSKVSSNRFVNNGNGAMGHSDNVTPMSEAPKGNNFGNSHGLHHRRKSHHHRCKCADRMNTDKNIESGVILDRNLQSYETEYGNRKIRDGTRNRNSQTYTSKAYEVRSPAESSDNYSQGSVVQQGIAVLPQRHMRIRKLNRMYDRGSGSNEFGRLQKLRQLPRSLLPSPFGGLPPHGPPPFGLPPHGSPPFELPPHGPPPFGLPPHGPPPFGLPPQGPPSFGVPPQGTPHGVPPHGQPSFGSPPLEPPPTGSLQHEQSISNSQEETIYNQHATDSQYPDLTTFNTTHAVSQYSPYNKQEHYFGSLGPLVGNLFDSFKMLNKPPPMPDRYQRLLGQQPYSSFQDHSKSFSTMGTEEKYSPLLSPSNMYSQYGQENQINSKTESSQTHGLLQQDGDGSDSDLNMTDTLKSESMTTADTQSRIVSTDGQPFTGYMKTIKTTKTVNGNNPPEIHVVKTESIIPGIDSNN